MVNQKFPLGGLGDDEVRAGRDPRVLGLGIGRGVLEPQLTVAMGLRGRW